MNQLNVVRFVTSALAACIAAAALVSCAGQYQLALTRKESHTLLEMLAQKARVVGWLDTAQLPHWLGAKP